MSTNKILIIEVKGEILNDEPENSFFDLISSEVTYGYKIKEQFVAAANDPQIAAVILEVNSPGGTVTGSHAIADGIEYYQSITGKKVYGFGSGLVASGGYWAIAATDEIFLDYGSAIGSIGVIMGPFVRYRDVVSDGIVVTENGITYDYITAGEGKDAGNPFRDLTSKEVEIFQKSIDDAYIDFVSYVSTQRGINEDEIVNNIGAHIYGEKQALELKLIDAIANREETIITIISELGLDSNDYQLIETEDTADFFGSIFGSKISTEHSVKASICNLTRTTLAIESEYIGKCK